MIVTTATKRPLPPKNRVSWYISGKFFRRFLAQRTIKKPIDAGGNNSVWNFIHQDEIADDDPGGK